MGRSANADSRIAGRDPDDWPTLALAFKLGVPIWSQDKDFSATGVEVVTAGELLDSLRAAGHDRRSWRPAASGKTEVPLSALEILRARRRAHQPPRLQALQLPRWKVTSEQ